MSVIKLAQRLLPRYAVNGFKVAALFFFATGGWLSLHWTGAKDLSSPWTAMPLLPLVFIYIAERLGTLRLFRGMTLPSLCVLAASTAMVWILGAKPPLPSAFAYAVVAGHIATLGFLMFRMWTFGPAEGQVR